MALYNLTNWVIYITIFMIVILGKVLATSNQRFYFIHVKDMFGDMPLFHNLISHISILFDVTLMPDMHSMANLSQINYSIG